jgi:predicted molibdopterin-dependent oxidoreductase YjgC
MGGLPNVFPAYQPVTVEANTEKFTSAWRRPLSNKIGYTVTDMVQAMIEGKLKALYVVGENPKVSDPDQNHLDKALANLEFLVCQDIFLTETTEKADVVFAGASVAEKEGTFTNTERRCMKVNKAIDPMGNTLNDWEIISRLSTAMGYEMNYENPEKIFNEMTALTPSYGGMTYERMGLDGLQWPCPNAEHPGTQFLHKDQFTRGKGLFHAIEYLDPAEMPDDEYPYWLTTGRMFAHFHTGTMTRVSKHLDNEQKTGYVEINLKDAKTLGVNDGDMVRLATRRGEMEVAAQVGKNVQPGVLFVPFHFAENPANILTNSAFDPIAKIPEFKVCAVKIEKAA